MVSDINFGSLSTIGGKTVTSGSASGLDTESLINGLVETKRLPAVALEENIELNKSKIGALNEANTILQSFKTALNSLRNPTGFGASSNNVFENRSAFVTTSDGSQATNYASIVSSDGAALGKYEIKVGQLAQGDIFQSASFSARDEDIVDTGLLVAGTFDLNGKTITVDDDETLESLVSKINNVENDTNVEASILKIADGDFRLVLTQSDTGLNANINIDTPNSGVFANINLTEIQAAQNAEITYIVGATETTISREKNTIDDFIENVSITLFEETPTDTTIKIDIDKDVTAVSTAVVDLVNAYNDFRVFGAQQSQTDSDGNLLETAVLSTNSLIDNTMALILNQIASTVNSPTQLDIESGDSFDRLGDIGISFADFEGNEAEGIPLTTNILEVDVPALTTALSSNFDDIRNLFEFSFQADSTSLNVLETANLPKAETVSVTVTGGATAVINSIDGYALASGYSLNYDTADERVTSGDNPGLVAVLKGADGTELEGLELLYYGDGDSTQDFSAELQDGERGYSLAINDSAETAAISHIHGLELASAIDLTYTRATIGSSASISGGEGSPIEGNSFLYVGGTTETISLTFNQGFASTLYNSIEDISSSDDTGAIAAEIESFLTSNERLESSIERIDLQIVSYRERLLSQFSALEAAISIAESTLQLLTAQADSRNNS